MKRTLLPSGRIGHRPLLSSFLLLWSLSFGYVTPSKGERAEIETYRPDFAEFYWNPANGKVTAELNVSGTVTDADGEPIPGVTVSIQGTSTGTATDIDGKYSIVAPEGSVLVFSFIGYETQTISVDSKSVIDVTLVEDMASLDEVVVIGYMTQSCSGSV